MQEQIFSKHQSDNVSWGIGFWLKKFIKIVQILSGTWQINGN